MARNAMSLARLTAATIDRRGLITSPIRDAQKIAFATVFLSVSAGNVGQQRSLCANCN